MRFKPTVVVLFLTLLTFLVHGYHPWAEDAEIYLPGVLKFLHPELFPFNSQFFQFHAGLSLFPFLIGESQRLTHIPLEWVLLLWQFASVFFLLMACRQLAERCFDDKYARWAGVLLVASLLTLPVAGTALYLLDQYINPRNLTACLGIFALVKCIDGKYFQAAFYATLAAVIHPLMGWFVLSVSALLLIFKHWDWRLAKAGLAFPAGLWFARPSPAYHEAALLHSFHYVTRWQWYEWLGAVAPLLILWWFGRLASARQMQNLRLLCETMVVYGVFYLAAGLALSIPARFEALARLQPMRSLHLLYIVFLVVTGGFLGEFILKSRIWRWLALFVPICTGMFIAQRALFADSSHVELPGLPSKNPWVQAFQWARENTPPDAVFSLDPMHLNSAGEDHNGFRAIAQRSSLADTLKDSGAVSMFPPLADEWLKQTRDQQPWNKFDARDFQRLKTKYGVTWIVVQQPGVAGLTCPYQNASVLVCRVN